MPSVTFVRRTKRRVADEVADVFGVFHPAIITEVKVTAGEGRQVRGARHTINPELSARSPAAARTLDEEEPPVTDAVIVSTARSPIGRAFKGSLKDMRPDDLSVQMIAAALAKIPALNPARHRGPLLGVRRAVGQAGRQHGPRHRRARGLRPPAGLDRQPLLRFVGADDPDGLPRDQGRRGRRLPLRWVECVSQYGVRPAPVAADANDQNPLFAGDRARSEVMARPNEVWTDPRELGIIPDVYLSMGQTAENVATSRGISRARQDEWGVAVAEPRRGRDRHGFFAKRHHPGDAARRHGGGRPTTGRARA
jgi:acetyl-CoA C-acetyltransferase